MNGGGLRPVVVVTLLAALFIAFPDRNFSFGDAEAASSSPECASGVGIGGPDSNTVASTVGGHGCVVIKYISDGVVQYETFNYTGADQTWTVPSGVTSAIFFLIGAGGGGFLMFYAEDKARLRHSMIQAGLKEVRFRFDFEGTAVVQ